VVGNTGFDGFTKFFDVTPPSTTYDISPAGADTNAGWTNKDVTLTLTAVDLPDQSGVDYTEWVKMVSSTTATPEAPALDASGTHGTVVPITDTAPVGPVYVYYRSVDKAVPANKEAWHLVMVFIDKNAPMLSDNAPTWWVNKGFDGNSFSVSLFATDPNSGVGPGEIMAEVPTWHPPITWFDTDGQVWFFVDPIGHMTDGIFPLNYKISDMAGNLATKSVDVKIDTRAPVTDGASDWINGTVPYVLTATDQVTGAGVSATAYRVDQSTPWLVNVASSASAQLMTSLPAWAQVQGAIHTIDFGSFDAALPAGWDPMDPFNLPSWHSGNFEGTTVVFGGIDHQLTTITGYKTRTVKLDVTHPVVTAMDPMNGEWQKGPAVINFTGTDVGSGYAFTEWSTDGGTTWHQGETATITGNSPKAGTVVTYHGVDKVGLKSADQTITVKVAATPPSVTAVNTTVKKGHRATFRFMVKSVTPRANVTILIRSLTGQTLSSHTYDLLVSGSQNSRSFVVNLKKGRYFIRIGAVDEAGNTQVKRGTAMLTVK